MGMGLPWQMALGAVFISGLLFVLLSVAGVRQAIVDAIPLSLKMAITGGIGAFLAFIGLKNAGIIVHNDATLVALGQLTAAPVWLALFGLVVSGALMARWVNAAMLWGILATSLLAIVTAAPVYAGGADGALQAFPGFNGFIAAPIWPADLVGKLDMYLISD